MLAVPPKIVTKICILILNAKKLEVFFTFLLPVPLVDKVHRMAEVRRVFWRSFYPTSLAKVGPPRVSCPGTYLDNFWLSPRKETSELLRQLVPALGHLYSEKNLVPDVWREPPVFLSVPIASGLINWAPLERAWLHLLYTPFSCL